ncbi:MULTISPECIES: putative entry exclusion protein TrbK-alt [unclassified Novosphingobium]|uniref:putative entry exclusion protein TrbK-alt n=1 Tax=unclassified Novosphingobium TaxID=2644732 RepID=UPI001469E3C3|nr:MULTISPECIES: putative entry exclusion protein TrbK-alt [unclassified Novosphingobium]NMN04831.1 conjugative transfer region protein TrbK [Novosphingobium sp. SG919]NMN85175.1 conjugative transfer region protein TrbK [Novosphingobium sp. SG916]
MRRTRTPRVLLLAFLGLAGLVALLALLLPAPHRDDAVTLLDTRPAVAAPLAGDTLARRCATIAVNDPAMASCAARWDARRRRFFGLPTRQVAGAGPAADPLPVKEDW